MTFFWLDTKRLWWPHHLQNLQPFAMLKSFCHVEDVKVIWIPSVSISQNLQKSTELGQPAQGQRDGKGSYHPLRGADLEHFTALKTESKQGGKSNMAQDKSTGAWENVEVFCLLSPQHRPSIHHLTIDPSPITQCPIATDLGPFFEMRMRDLVLGHRKKLDMTWHKEAALALPSLT